MIFLALMGARLVDLQMLRHDQYQGLANQQLRKTISLPATRGGFYDRNGAVLAMSIPTKEIIADPIQIHHPEEEAKALAPLIGVPADEILRKLKTNSQYQVLATHVSQAKAAIISRDAFEGITMVDTSKRTVPSGSLAASVIGMTSTNQNGKEYLAGVGSAGLEYQFQDLLAGRSGSETLLQTPFGVSLPQEGALRVLPAVAGTGLEVTLDQPLQYVTEQALGAAITSSHAISGTAIVIDTRTGEILSMANLVSTERNTGQIPTPLAGNPLEGIAGVAQAQNNLAVTQTYEPGSVFKIVPFSAALDSGVVTPDTTIGVPDHVTVEGKTFHDAEQHAPMSMTATQILAQSSNIGTYEIARQLGETRLLAQVQRLGFGQATGLSFPGESPGLLMNTARWTPTDIAALPIGQVDAVTPLQVLDAYNAVANGGVLMAPKLIRAKVGVDGNLSPTKASTHRRVMSVGTANQLNAMLQEVVSTGTGNAAAIPGYRVAGKTGTSQIPTPGQASYVDGAYNATFVGFAPADHPVLSALVVLERPTPNYFGGEVSAPVFAKIMSYALHRYGIPTSPGGSGSQTASATANFAREAT